MSVVTNVLVTGLIRRGEVDKVNDKLRTDPTKPGELACMNKAAGGHKCLEQDVYGGGFNYLDLDRLFDYLGDVTWDFPETIRVFVCEQEEDAYRLRWHGDEGRRP